MIVVLINDTVKKYLLKQDAGVRKKIRDKFEFLETGIWDGGLKVKKLKGVSSKRVFEARMDRGNRILFTLGRAERVETSTEDTHVLIVYVWGIVEHDDISKKSRTIIPDNVPFLQFKEYSETMLDSFDMEELEPSYFTQEAITEKISDESAGGKWFPIDNDEWKRIQLYRRDDLELFLYLSPEQKDILQSPLPLMISGTAGSGKTTLSVYYLLNRALNKRKKLFVTYNKHLKNYAEKLYNGLLNQREWKKDVIPPDFYTFKDLCLEAVPAYHPEKEVDFNRFKQLFTAYPGYRSFDPILVWEEIRAVIKGAVPRVDLTLLENTRKEIQQGRIAAVSVKQLQTQFILFSKLESMADLDKFSRKYLKISAATFAADIEKYLNSDNPREREGVISILDKSLQALKKQSARDRKQYLSYLEYESLGKKKAPNFTVNRKEIYRIYEWYQTKLENEKLWDELDLTARVVGKKDLYDTLVCDEVQDFTDTQLDLLFGFVKDPNHIFLAGDTKQTINPSGFRWEEVRKHFFERGLTVPPLKTLTLNFRSSGNIVELSNILLQLKEKFTGKKAEEIREEWKYKGRPVSVAAGIAEKDMLDILKVAGAKRTVLVRTDPEKEKLKKYLDTELVFTIKEAKGLEFDTVVLWKFCREQSAEDIWKVTLDMSDRNIPEAKITHEINLLYVGITRSQKNLIIYDGKIPSVIWGGESIKSNVYITDDRQFLEGVWDTVSSPEEWVEQGHYFFERGYFKAAVECFRNGGNTDHLAKAGAFYYEETGNFHEAAENFEILGEMEKAALNYEKAGSFKQALHLWEQLKNQERVLLCRAAALKEDGEYSEAGRLYVKMEQYDNAVQCFKQADDYSELAALYRNHFNDNKQAARYYERSQDYESAADLYVRLKDYDKAASLYYMSKNYAKAETYWKKTKNTEQLWNMYRNSGNNEKLFLIYQKEKNLDKALEHLKRLNHDPRTLITEARQLYNKRRYFEAVVRFLAAKDDQGIGQSFFKLKKYKEAIPYLEDAGEFYLAAEALYKIKKFVAALECFMVCEESKAEGHIQVTKILNRVAGWEWVETIALDYFHQEKYEEAAFLFSHRKILAVKEGLCHLHLGDTEKAFDTWCSSDQFELETIADLAMEQDFRDIAAQFFLKLTVRVGAKPSYSFSRGPNTNAFKLMDTYFAQNPKPEEMGLWGRFVSEKDFNCKCVNYAARYLEKDGRYNDMIAYYSRYLLFAPEFPDDTGDFKKNCRRKQWIIPSKPRPTDTSSMKRSTN